MERRSLNQKGGSSSQQTRQEGIISKEVKASSPTKQTQDFIRLEYEELHKDRMSSRLDEELHKDRMSSRLDEELHKDRMSSRLDKINSSQSIVASQEQRGHEAGLVDHSQESQDHHLKEKLEKSIAKHFNNFENFIRNFKEIKAEANRLELEEVFSTCKKNIEQSNYLLCCSLKEVNFAEVEKCIRECEARKRDFEILEFMNAFKTKIVDEGNGRFFVESTARRSSGYFQNRIGVDKGQIIGINNKKYSTKNWYFSDVIYNQLRLVLAKAGKDISQFDLRSWYGRNVVNEETEHIAAIHLGENHQKVFKPFDGEFKKIMKTATAKSKVQQP